ncbi:MAG: ABC transporter ATP-binding protein [Gemmatimonadales bacterium]
MRLIDPHVRRALGFVRPYAGALAPVVLLSLVSTGLALWLPYLSKLLVDNGILARNFAALVGIVGLFVGVTALSFGLNVITGMRYTRISADILFDMRAHLYRHLQRLSPRYYARTPLGDVVARINGDIGEIQRVTTDAVLGWLGQTLTLVGTVVLLAWLDLRLFLVSLVVLPPALWALVRYRSELEARVRSLRERSAEIGTFLIETLQGMRTVVGANAQERELERFRARNGTFVRALLSMRLFTYLAGGLPGLLLTAGTAIVFLYGGYRVIAGLTTLGTFVAFMAYQARLMGPLRGLMGLWTNLASVRASLVRVHEVLDTVPDVVEAESPIPLDRCAGAVSLTAVRVGFGRGGEVLDGVSLEIPAGQVIAVVGSSGCGKSTLADLLGRHLDPDAGCVRLDGTDLRELALTDVRRHIAVVEQDPFLFHASLAENIGYARPDASRDEIERASRAAGLSALLGGLPEGLDTVVGERGKQLSSGERQRVALARALVADPAVLVLDEATGALDPSTESEIVDRLADIRRGRTTVVITHRLDLARRADRAVVIERGRVVEDGTPRQLESEGRVFPRLFASSAAR